MLLQKEPPDVSALLRTNVAQTLPLGYEFPMKGFLLSVAFWIFYCSLVPLVRGIIERGWRGGGKLSKLCGKDVKMKRKFSVLIFISSTTLSLLT